MAGSNVDTCIAFQVSYCKGQRRSRHQFRINIGLDVVGSQSSSSLFGKYIGFDAAVIGNGNRSAGTDVVQIIGKTLCCLSYGIDVNSVGTCADYATQTGGAEC